MNTTPEDYEAVKKERDALLKAAQVAQKDAADSRRVIELLIVAGFVTQEKVNQAIQLAEL